MIVDRLKNILRATINDHMEKLGDNDYDVWKTYFEEDSTTDTSWKDTNIDEEYRKWEDNSHNYTNTHNNEAKKEAEYYADLELKPGASFKEIKSAYRKLVKLYHPDLFQGDPKKKEIADEVTRKINEAYNYFEKKFNK